MKRFLLLLLILPCLVKAQVTYFTPDVPPSSVSFSPTWRFLGTDSLANFYINNSNRWSLLYTAAQSNIRFLRTPGNGTRYYSSLGINGLGGQLDTTTQISLNGWPLKFFEPSNSTGLYINPGRSVESVGLYWGTIAGTQGGGFKSDTTGDFTTIYYVTPGGKNQSLSLNPVTGGIFNDDAADIGISYPHSYSANATPLTLMPKSYIDSLAAIGGGTSTPTANTTSQWDGHVNFSANSFIPAYTTTVGAGSGTISLTVSSPQQQYVTGSLSQTFNMPLASTLVEGQYWIFTSLGGGGIVVKTSLGGSNLICVVPQNATAIVTCILNSGSTTASWSYRLISNTIATGTVSSIGTGLGLSGGPITGTGTITADTTVLKSKAGFLTDYNNLVTSIATKQATLVSGTNIKTVNSVTLLGSGNLAIEPANTDTTSSTGFATQQTLIPYLTKAQIVSGYQPIGTYVASVTGTTNRITSTGGTTPIIDISATFEALLGKVANPLSQFASTTSAQLAGVLSDETGTGVAVFNKSATFVGSTVMGTPAGTAGTDSLVVKHSGGVLEAIPANSYLTTSGGVPLSSVTDMTADHTINNAYLFTLGATNNGFFINGHTGSLEASLYSLDPSTFAGGIFDATPTYAQFAFNNASGIPSALTFNGSTMVVADKLDIGLQTGGNYHAGMIANKHAYIDGLYADSAYSIKAGSSSITTVGTLGAGSIPYSLLTGTPSLLSYLTAVGVATANGVSGSSSGGTTPNLTIALGAIAPTTISTTIKPATIYQTAAGTAGTDSVMVKHSGGIVDAISATYYAPLSSPSFTTPALGVASATTINKVTISAPATSATLTIANSGTLQLIGAFTLGLTATATTTPTFPTGTGTLAYLGGTNAWTGANTFLDFYSTSSTPSKSAGTGAGTGPTITIVGNNQDGKITVLTGTTPAASSIICTFTMSGSFAYPTSTACTLTPAGTTTELLSGAAQVYMTGTSTTFVLNAGSTNLTAATTYVWYYHNGGY